MTAVPAALRASASAVATQAGIAYALLGLPLWALVGFVALSVMLYRAARYLETKT